MSALTSLRLGFILSRCLCLRPEEPKTSALLLFGCNMLLARPTDLARLSLPQDMDPNTPKGAPVVGSCGYGQLVSRKRVLSTDRCCLRCRYRLSVQVTTQQPH